MLGHSWNRTIRKYFLLGRDLVNESNVYRQWELQTDWKEGVLCVYPVYLKEAYHVILSFGLFG